MSKAYSDPMPESRAIILHLGEIATSAKLITPMLHHISIELENGFQSQIWNFDNIDPEAFSWQIKRLCMRFPSAVILTQPPNADMAIFYGLSVLEAVAPKMPVALADRIVIIVERAEHVDQAERKLAGMGLHGTVWLLDKFLFTLPNAASAPLWKLVLETDTRHALRPETFELGVSFVGRETSDADLAFLSALQRETGHPVVLLAEETQLAKLQASGAEVLVAKKTGSPWGAFFDRVTLLVDIGNCLEKTRLHGAITQALHRNRGVVALSDAGVATPGVTSFQTEPELFAFLRGFEINDVDAFLRQSQAEVSTHVGADLHVKRLKALLPDPIASPVACHPVPDKEAGLDVVVRFLIEAPVSLGLEWLLLGPKSTLLRKVLQRLGALHELSKITDLYEAAAAFAPGQHRGGEAGAGLDSTHFWLGAHAASAYANYYVRDRALQIMMLLDTTAYRKRLTADGIIQFQQRKANVLVKARQRDESLAVLTELAEQYPDSQSTLIALGLAVAATAPQHARDILQKALNLSKKPHPMRLSAGLAQTLCVLGQHEQALEVLHAAVESHGDEPSLRIGIANAHLGLGYRKDWADVLLPLFPTQDGKPALAINIQAGLPVLDIFTPAQGLKSVEVDAAAPLVAVVMTAYNAADTIAQAMRSVLAQTYPKLRLVVVDDASTDATLAVVREIAQQDPRVIILQQRENAGTYVAKNQALSLVYADYYTFLDSDDLMHPDRIAAHLSFMARNPEVVCSYSKWIRVAPQGEVVTMPLENPASCFLRRATLEEFGYFDMVRASADGEFRWRLRRRYGRAAVPVMPEILTIGTQREGSLTTGGLTAFDDFGYSAPRVAYAEAWSNWHRNCSDPSELYLPFPQQRRVFAAPPELAVPVTPFPHPFALRPENDVPSEDAVIVEWPAKEDIVRNWGDKLNEFLVHKLSGKTVLNHLDPKKDKKAPIHLVIGSGLANTSERKLVWGSGFIDSQMRLKSPPRQICAVRGPLSRAHVIETEGNCTDVLGDAALLCPLIYLPEIAVQFDVGVILHFREAGIATLPLLPKGTSVRLIDINGGIEEVIDNILSCKHIVSSSLHGIIAAHAYGVPATWLRFTERPKGDGFKFRDYWSSVDRDNMEPTQIQPGETLYYQATIATPGETMLVDLYRLLRACPFLTPEQAEELVQRAKDLRPKARRSSILNCHAGVIREG